MGNFHNFPTPPNNSNNRRQSHQRQKESSLNKESKPFTFDNINDTLETDTYLVSDEHKNVGKVYKMYYNSKKNNIYAFEASDLHEEKDKELFNHCDDNDNTSFIT